MAFHVQFRPQDFRWFKAFTFYKGIALGCIPLGYAARVNGLKDLTLFFALLGIVMILMQWNKNYTDYIKKLEEDKKKELDKNHK